MCLLSGSLSGRGAVEPGLLEDVREQLAGQAPGADGRLINDPKGFAENFARKKLAGDPLGLVPDDVLGYYQATDLPFYA
jgi:hypothetical protein